VLISPDGGLNLVPFETLVDDHGRHTIERYATTYLTSGRDPLRMQIAPAARGKPSSSPIRSSANRQPWPLNGRGQARRTDFDRSRSDRTCPDCISLRCWERPEARAIKSLFPMRRC
jgi:hypothetical protein